MAFEPVNVACIGMGWWSDVLADAIKRSGKLQNRRVLHALGRQARRRSPPSTAAAPRASYEAILADQSIDAIINTTPNNVHLETTARRGARRASTCFSTSRSPTPIADGARSRAACRESRRRARASATSAARESQFRWIRQQIDAGVFGKLVNAEANISRDRLGKIDLSSWRYTAEGMPGGVMLQIGIHYTDVLEYLIGPVKSVQRPLAQLVLPGDNPDVASLVLRARERRALHAERELRLGVRVLPDEHLRQGSHRLLRSAQRACAC